MKKEWAVRTRKTGRGYYWEIVRVLDGRELATPMRYGRKYTAMAKLEELNKE